MEPLYYINGDWMINLYCSQIGTIGYLNKLAFPSIVCMVAVSGVLTGGTDRILRTIDAILRYNSFTDYNFSDGFNWLIRIVIGPWYFRYYLILSMSRES